MNDARLSNTIRAAEICIPCADLAATLAFFTGTLGFRVDMIFPADAPHTAVISAHGVRLRLEKSATTAALPTLRLRCDDLVTPTKIAAPNGLMIELVNAGETLTLPGKAINREFVTTRFADAHWGTGRAGMQYRDLIPSRLSGRFIASHIRIPEGGEVPDYVHYHKVRFQMIYCKRGWVRVVYEDQGEPFVMHTGDCVLQPPGIRHRVLEASVGLEVIEIGCPAIHETWADPSLALPTKTLKPDRDFDGQRFVRHVAAFAAWNVSEIEGFEVRDTGIDSATRGLARVRVLRACVNSVDANIRTAGEFHFLFVLAGKLHAAGNDRALHAGDSCVLPGTTTTSLQTNLGTELLEVTLPAQT
jgi:quercetin dioxygenase-like cupin family protein